MLIEQLKELIEYGMVDKQTYDGYPLHVEYSLTKRGEQMLMAMEIMQAIGMEMMLEDGREEFLKDKGLLWVLSIHSYKKVGTVQEEKVRLQ